jgi:hypothetical protein
MFHYISRHEDRFEPKVHVVYQRAPVVADIIDLLDKWCPLSETQQIVYADFLCRHESEMHKILHDCSDILFCWDGNAQLRITLNVSGSKVLVIHDNSPAAAPAKERRNNNSLVTGFVSFVSVCVVFRLVSSFFFR